MMNEQLQTALADVVTVLKDATAWSAAVAKQELPLLVQEYLRWGVVDAVACAVGWGLIVYGLLRLGKVCREFPYREPRNHYGGEGRAFGLAMGSIGFRALAALFSVGVFVNLMVAAKILAAPRVYLLEQVSQLVGGGR